MSDTPIPLIDNNQFGNIPGYDPTQASPQAQASGEGSGPGDILSQLSAKANAPLPSPYSIGSSVADPKVPQVRQYQPVNSHRAPINGQATNIRLARQQNNFASIANFIGAAGQRIQEKKQTAVKEDLSKLLKAKQNVHNAEAVLQSDPNNAMAKDVLTKNKAMIEAMANDPKKVKMLQKALDVSFTDPEKNKTPEVQAAQAAFKEHKEAGAFNSDNPAEHQVAQQATNGGKPQEQKSATPRADAILAKDVPEITANPLYATALAERKEAQTQLTKALPAVIKGEYEATLQRAKAGDQAALQYYKDQAATFRANMKLVNDANIANLKAGTELKRQAMADATSMRNTNMRVDAMLKVSQDRNLTAEHVATIKSAGSDLYDKQIKTVTAASNDMQKRRKDIELTPDDIMSGPQKQEQLGIIDAALKLQNNHLTQLQTERAKRFGEANGPATTIEKQNPSGPSEGGVSFKGVPLGIPGIVGGSGIITGVGGSSSYGNNKPAATQQAGADESDEPELDDDDEANYP